MIIKLNKDNKESIDISSGIRQGCNGSTSLFKLVTYKIAKELMAMKMGYKDKHLLPISILCGDGLDLYLSRHISYSLS